ncbi:MAG: triose-phosphate isomerase [Rhodocyclaceae bacterium]
MKRMLVVGNWKMNGRLGQGRSLAEAVRAGWQFPEVECALCVPFPYLLPVAGVLADSPVRFGAQNLSEFDDGAYTGEVSAGMLCDTGCTTVIVGHSERRAMQGEGDAQVARKARAALEAGLTPIVCVGETLAQREQGALSEVLGAQLGALANEMDRAMLGRLVVAYEPVWAIGTGVSASPAQVQAVLADIRAWLQAHAEDAQRVPVLYGGSVKPDTAQELFSLPDCNGGLIGGAALVAADFVEIGAAAARALA